MMDVDLSEYDQIDEIKLIQDNHEKVFGSATTPSTLLETISSNSSSMQNTYDEANCENDFVFLPAPLSATPAQATSQQQLSQAPPRCHQGALPATANQVFAPKTTTTTAAAAATTTTTVTNSGLSRQTSCFPLVAINNNTKNPFCQQVTTPGQESIGLKPIRFHQASAVPISTNPQPVFSQTASAVAAAATASPIVPGKVIENYTPNKPVGLLEVCPNLVSANPNKLTYLMQQIVTRADMIYIAIPCPLCHEPVACPPLDISAWLGHMSSLHNCKICPICDKLVGLGPRRDIEIMQKHVTTHLDDEWLERRPPKRSVTYGLQQQWFSGSRCSVKETRGR